MSEAAVDLSIQASAMQPLIAQLAEEIERCRRYRQVLTVAVLCIDELAQLRETLSTITSNAVLNVITGVLRSNLREQDFCTVLDDQSFVIILSRLPVAQACQVAQKLKDKIDTHTITCNWRNIKIGVSIGLASYPLHGDDAGKLIACATAAAQFALSSGGDRIVIA